MNEDEEIVIGWEPHMMRSIGPRAKMLVFGTKYGMVVVTNRRFLFLSEGKRWDFASYISIQGVDANMRKVSYAFMSKFGMNRSKLYELVNAAKKSR